MIVEELAFWVRVGMKWGYMYLDRMVEELSDVHLEVRVVEFVQVRTESCVSLELREQGLSLLETRTVHIVRVTQHLHLGLIYPAYTIRN